MAKSGLTQADLAKLVPDIVDTVSKQLVEALKNSVLMRGGYDCTGTEFDCLNKYECANSDTCENTFDCPKLYREARR